MASGDLSSAELTEAYLRRIERLEPDPPRGHRDEPARARDRRAPRPRQRRPARVAARSTASRSWSRTTSPRTTRWRRPPARWPWSAAASRATRGSWRRLRAAGAVILGKANLSEWANFRGLVPPAVKDAGLHLNGWSARGGFTREPVRARLGPVRVELGLGGRARRQPVRGRGRHRDRRLDRLPGRRQRDRRAQADGRAGRARTGSSRSRTARTRPGRWPGPSPTPRSCSTSCARRSARSAGRRLPRDYRDLPATRRAARRADRRRRRLFAGDESADAGLNDVAERALAVMTALGATLVDPDRTARHATAISEAELTVLFTEFKVGIDGLPRRRCAGTRDAHARRPDRVQRRALRRGAALLRPGAFHVADATTGLDDPVYRDGPSAAACASRGPMASTGSWPTAGSTPSSRRPTAIRRRPGRRRLPSISVPTGTTPTAGPVASG